jgi:hypothetical protein
LGVKNEITGLSPNEVSFDQIIEKEGEIFLLGPLVADFRTWDDSFHYDTAVFSHFFNFIVLSVYHTYMQE